MVLSLTRYLSFYKEYKIPVRVFQKRKYLLDNELNDMQFLQITENWRNNQEQCGIDVCKEGFTMAKDGSNPALVNVSAIECVLRDGVATFINKQSTVDVSALGDGTYDIVLSITYESKQSTDDNDLIEPTLGSETAAIITQTVTISALASTPETRIQDTTLSTAGTTGSGATLRYLVDSTNDYSSTPNRFRLGWIEGGTGEQYKIEDQQDNTPVLGQTRFVIDTGPNQSGPSFSPGVGGYINQPLPFYGPINSYAVRYVKLGEVVVASGEVSSVTVTINSYKTSKDFYTAFTSEHFTGGGHGPNVQITTTGSSPALDFVNSGTGSDVDGTGSSWSVAKTGDAEFNTVTIKSLPVCGVLVVDDSVSAVTTHNVIGIDGNSDHIYKLILSGQYQATAAGDLIVVKPNNDTSAVNFQSYCRDNSCTHGVAFGSGNYDLSATAGLPIVRAAYAGPISITAELILGAETGKQRMATCQAAIHSVDNVVTINETISSVWQITATNITSLYLDFSSIAFTGRIQLIKLAQ